MEHGSTQGKLQRTPTWRAKCRIIRVPAKPLRFELWGAHEDLSPLSHALTMILELSTSNSQNKGHMVYTGSGHLCGVILYSSVVWWIASWAEDEQVQGTNILLRRGVLELDELVCVRRV